MQDFEVNDDLTMKVSPTVIVPETYYAQGGFNTSSGSALGLRLGLTF